MEEVDRNKESFSKVMKKATREIHSLSDALINAKLGFASSDSTVWAEGLLVFYEVFKFLEQALDSTSNENLLGLDIKGMRRTQKFEKDLAFYLGEKWQINYTPCPSVQEYISHLRKLQIENPVLLAAYIYHLYMGLFSGGQILKKKRALILKLTFSSENPKNGLAVVELDDKSASCFKKEMREAMDYLANKLDENTKLRLIEESKMVFILNNKIVNSIKGTNAVILYKIVKFAGIASVFALTAYLVRRYSGL